MRIKKRRFRNNRNNTKLTALILVVLVFVCATGYAYFSQSLDLTSTANLATDNPNCDIGLFKGYNDFTNDVTYEVYDTNNGHEVHAKITLTNVGTKYINHWRSYVQLPENAELQNYYNCKQIFEGDANIYENPEENYNAKMEANGGTLSFDLHYIVDSEDYYIKKVSTYGWNINIETVTKIEEMSSCLNGGTIEEEKQYLAATFTTGNTWADGELQKREITVTVANSSEDESIRNWYFLIDVGESGSVTGCYSATCEQNGNLVKVTQPSWGMVIPANGSINMNFQLTILPDHIVTITKIGRLS